MLKRLLLISFFFVFNANAQIRSGHHEFVHYTEAQKEDFIVKVMDLMVELESKYETAPAIEKKRYSAILNELKEILFSNAYAADGDVSRFSDDLSSLLVEDGVGNRCIYAGWVSRTVTHMDPKRGHREICQHPKFIKGGKNGAEAQAYAKSSQCGKKNQNTIACNPAIFGYKNKKTESQFCVAAGPTHADNSSYSCMQLSLGLKVEKGADPAKERIDYLKKQFEGNKPMVNNLFGFIYKTCLCDDSEKNVINKVYKDYMKPHRTCLGLVNTIAEVNHCVEYGAGKTSEMEMFKGIRNFTSDIVKKTRGTSVDKEYTNLLGSLKSRFSTDYQLVCGGETPPKDEDDKIPDDTTPPSSPPDDGTIKDCKGECDLVDGKWDNCTFTSEDKPLKVDTYDNDGGQTSFTTNIDGIDYLCHMSERDKAPEEVKDSPKTSCSLKVSDSTVSYELSGENSSEVKVEKANWTPAGVGSETAESVAFGTHPEISLNIDIDYKGEKSNINCGSVPNPSKGDAPKIKIKDDGKTPSDQKFGSDVEPKDPEGWEYEWSRSNPPPKKDTPPKIQGDSDDEGDSKPTPPSTNTKIDNKGPKYTAPKEDKEYQVCVKLTKGDQTSNEDCSTVPPKSSKESPAKKEEPAPKPAGGPQLPQMPNQMRKGVDFSAGGVL